MKVAITGGERGQKRDQGSTWTSSQNNNKWATIDMVLKVTSIGLFFNLTFRLKSSSCAYVNEW